MLARPTEPARGAIDVTVRHGAVTLTGIVPSYFEWRVAEVKAWRCLGAHTVENVLDVMPNQVDGDPQLEHAIRYVLGIEPLLEHCRIEVFVDQSRATLGGSAPDGPAREIAEYATWFVPGVVDVHNELVLDRETQEPER